LLAWLACLALLSFGNVQTVSPLTITRN